MNADGKIYIIITDKLPSGTTPTPEPGGGIDNPDGNNKNENSLLGHWARDKLLSTAKQVALKAVNYQLSNIGNFTGDYIEQTHINDALHNLRAVGSIAAATLAGAAQGGWIGAIIGFTTGTIEQAVGGIMEIHSNRVQNSKINYEIAQLKDRSGLNTTLDGSRGTEN